MKSEPQSLVGDFNIVNDRPEISLENSNAKEITEEA